MLLLVDGYNLYYTGLHEYGRKPDLEKARDQVTQLIRRYCLAKTWRAIIFWDGAPAGKFMPRAEFREGVEARYSPPRSDADTEIKGYISGYPDPRQLHLVTSDRDIQRFAAAAGVQWTASRAFISEAADLLGRNQADENDGEPQEKLDGPGGDELDYWLKVFRKE